MDTIAITNPQYGEYLTGKADPGRLSVELELVKKQLKQALNRIDALERADRLRALNESVRS